MTNPQNVIAPETVAEALFDAELHKHPNGCVPFWDVQPPEVKQAFLEKAERFNRALHRLPTQSPSEELLAAEAENNRLREVVDDMRVTVARITNDAATEIVLLKGVLKPFAGCVYNDNGDVTFDKSLLTNDDYWRAYRAMRALPPLAQSPLSQGGVTLRELGESYCKEQPAPGAEAIARETIEQEARRKGQFDGLVFDKPVLASALRRCADEIERLKAALHRLPAQSPLSQGGEVNLSSLQDWVDKYPGDKEALIDALIVEIGELRAALTKLAPGAEAVVKAPLRMNAYYFAFSPTGCLPIDKILSAVAAAGKAYHHTDCWGVSDGQEPSYAEQIQRAAEAAARELTALRSPAIPAPALPETITNVARALCRQYEIDDGYSIEQADKAAASEMYKNFIPAAKAAIAAAMPAPAQGVTEEMVERASKVIADMSPQWRLCGDPPCRPHNEMPVCRCPEIASAALEAALHPSAITTKCDKGPS